MGSTGCAMKFRILDAQTRDLVGRSVPGSFRSRQSQVRIPKREREQGIGNPARAISEGLLRLEFNGDRRAPATTSTVIAADVAVEPDIERIGGVSAQETRSSKLEAGLA